MSQDKRLPDTDPIVRGDPGGGGGGSTGGGTGPGGSGGGGGTPTTGGGGGGRIPGSPKPAGPTPPDPRSRRVTPPKGGTKPVDPTPTAPKKEEGGETPEPSRILPEPIQLPPSRTDTFVPPRDWKLPVIYGKVKTGGAVFYDSVQSGGNRVVAYAICWGEINNVTAIEIEGVAIASLSATYNIHVGTAGQGIDSIGAATSDTALWTSGLPYVAYVVINFAAPAAGQASLPDVRNAVFTVEGKKVFDPRTDATLTNKYYRTNPALCLADLIVSTQYGESQPSAQVYSASLSTAADDCDFDIGGGVKRYEIGLKLESQPAKQAQELIRAHGALQVSSNSGAFVYWVDKARSAAAVALTDTGAGANIISAGPLIVAGAKQIPTRARINFQNAAAGYKDDFAIYPAGALTSDDIVRTWDLGTITGDQAGRLVRQFYKRAILDKSFPVRALPDVGEQLLPGVRVPVTSAEVNLSAYDCLITDWTPSSDPNFPSMWEGRLEYYSASVYDDTAVSASASAPPANPSPYQSQGNVTGLTVASATAPATMYFTKPANTSNISHYKVYRGLSPATGELIGIIPRGDEPTSSKPFDVEALVSRTFNPTFNQYTAYGYSICVTTVSTKGVESSGTSQAAQTIASTTGNAPAVPQSQTTLTLANGLNSDVTLPAGPGLLRFNGPTGAFSLGGLTGGGGGVVLPFYNGSGQAGTLVDEDASSTAANRIRTRTGANVSVPDGTGGFLVYNTTANRWILFAWNDGTVFAALASPAFTGNPTAPTPAAGDNDTSIATSAFVQTEAGLGAWSSVSPTVNGMPAFTLNYRKRGKTFSFNGEQSNVTITSTDCYFVLPNSLTANGRQVGPCSIVDGPNGPMPGMWRIADGSGQVKIFANADETAMAATANHYIVFAGDIEVN